MVRSSRSPAGNAPEGDPSEPSRPAGPPSRPASSETDLSNPESDLLLREAVDAGGIGIWCWTSGSDVVSANASARRLWGFGDRTQIPSSELLACIHPDDVDRVQMAAREARASPGPSEIAFRIRRGGETRWIRVRGGQAAQGGRSYLVGICADVTARVQTEASLSATEARLQRAQALGGAFPFEWDAKTNQVVTSDRFNRLHGVAPGAAADLEVFLARIHPDDRARVKRDLHRQLDSPGPYETEFRVILPNGEERWMLSRGEAVRDAEGASTGVAGLNLDISRRKRVEEDLRRARQGARARFREIKALYHGAPVGLALLDRDLRQVRVNRRLAEIAGRLPGRPIGDSIFDVVPDLRPKLAPVLREVIETGEPRGNIEVERPSPTGTGQLVFNCHFYPLKADAGLVLGIGVVVEDVTAYKSAVHARDLLSRELSHRIKNLFAVVSSLVTLSARGDQSLQPFARSLRGRIEALGRAHDYVRPSEWDRTAGQNRTLHNLLATVLAPYKGAAESGAPSPIRLDGSDVPIGPFAATALALTIHEFATNAVKYGALSRPDGYVEISSHLAGDTIELTWSERGGPTVAGPPEREGFGSMLARRSFAADLNGSIEAEWAPEGLLLRLRAPLGRLAR